MKLLIITVTLALASLTGKIQAQNLYGTWEGFVTVTCRLDKCDTQAVALTLNGTTGTIHYPTTQCTGTLAFENKTGDIYYYREHVVKGHCTDGAVVAVVPAANEVAWTRTSSKQCLTGNLPGTRTLISCAQCIGFRDSCLSACNDITHPGDKTDCEQKCTDEYACIAGTDCAVK